LSCCASTGDPHQGGYLGWSEKKSGDRQNAMKSELVGLHQEGDELQDQRSSLQGEIAALHKKLRAAKARQDAAAVARIENEIRSKEARLGVLLEAL